MNIEKKELHRQIIIKNSVSPNNLVETPIKNYDVIEAISDTCNESYDIFIKIKDGKIKDLKFMGNGCSISKAAINIICNMLHNKDIKTSIDIILNYTNMVYNKKFKKDMINELIVFKNISIHKNRISCALIGSDTIQKFLKKIL